MSSTPTETVLTALLGLAVLCGLGLVITFLGMTVPLLLLVLLLIFPFGMSLILLWLVACITGRATIILWKRMVKSLASKK